MKIEKLTKEQESKISKYREKYFGQAVSTEPADRARAEAAALKIAKIVGVEISSVEWVDSPKLGASLRASLRASIMASLLSSLSASLRAFLGDSLRALLWASLLSSLSASLRAFLGDSLRASLLSSLLSSLSASLRAFLGDSLRASLWASFWDTGWLAFYSFCVDELKIKIDESTREKLRLHNEIAASCFALWIVPGTIILCERPSRIEITDGNVVDIEFNR
jgi:hypothetical protein